MRSPSTGEVRYRQYTSTPVRDEKGDVVGAVATARDITERKRAEEKSNWLTRFPEDNPNPVLRVSADGILLYQNPATDELAGWMCGEGEPVTGEMADLAVRAFGRGRQVHGELSFGERIFHFSAVPFIRDHYVNIYGLDITKRRSLEEALRQSEEHYRELVQNANSAIIRWNSDGPSPSSTNLPRISSATPRQK